MDDERRWERKGGEGKVEERRDFYETEWSID